MNVDEIVTRMGGQTEAAKRLGYKRPRVGMWQTRGKLPPKEAEAVAQALGVELAEVWPATQVAERSAA